MLTLLPGDESTTWNDDIVSCWSLHLSAEKGADDIHYIFVVFTKFNLSNRKEFIFWKNAFL